MLLIVSWLRASLLSPCSWFGRWVALGECFISAGSFWLVSGFSRCQLPPPRGGSLRIILEWFRCVVEAKNVDWFTEGCRNTPPDSSVRGVSMVA